MEPTQLCERTEINSGSKRHFVFAPTSVEIDDIIIGCLQVFAARGRALRLAREKEKSSHEQQRTPLVNTIPPDEYLEPVTSMAMCIPSTQNQVGSRESG